MDSRVEMVLKVIEVGWRLVETLRETHPYAPYEDLYRALKALDVHAGVEQSDGIGSGFPRLAGTRVPSHPEFGIARESLVEGEEYLLHAPGMSAEPISFVYLGTAKEDSVAGMDKPSFWMKRGDKVEKWFYADAGLEQYSRHGESPWWHKENWVSRASVSRAEVQEMLRRLFHQKDDSPIETDEDGTYLE